MLLWSPFYVQYWPTFSFLIMQKTKLIIALQNLDHIFTEAMWMILLYFFHHPNLLTHVETMSSKHQNMDLSVKHEYISLNDNFTTSAYKMLKITNQGSFIPTHQNRGLLYISLLRGFLILRIQKFHLENKHLKAMILKIIYPLNFVDSLIK